VNNNERRKNIMDEIQLGDMARDDLTGFEGVVTGRTHWLSNCDRLTLQPKGLKDGQPQKDVSFDITHCVLVSKAAHAPAAKNTDQREHILLGDTARDEITGFEGVVTARAHFLTICDRLVLQPKTLDKDGQPQKSAGFDVTRVALVSSLQPPAPKEVRGGPMDDVRRAADPGRP
jgi:4-hydroxy-3-methylbut-2-enyl diphosphate reductase IspH